MKTLLGIVGAAIAAIISLIFTSKSSGSKAKELDLLKPIYKKTACFGHFGRDEFPWENIKGNEANLN